MAGGSCRLGLIAAFSVLLAMNFVCNYIAGDDYRLNLQSLLQSASQYATLSVSENSPAATEHSVSKTSASFSASLAQVPRKLQEWHPVGMIRSQHGPAVSLVSLGHPRPSQLLKKSKRRIESRGSRGSSGAGQRVMPVEEFIRAVDRNEFGVPARTIFVSFKIGRCGSTLLDMMLARDPRFLLVAEPSVMNSVRREIRGDDEQARDLRRRTFHALVKMLAVPLTFEQEVAVLDMNSQSTHSVSDIVAGANMANAHSFFLWRNPIEAADSFFGHPPGWLRNRYVDESDRSHVAEIKRHLEAMSGAVQHMLAAGGHQFQVFWYQQVVSGLVPEWMLNKSFSHSDPQAMRNLMDALLIDAKTGKPRDQDKIDHDELKLTGALKELGQVWYNAKLIEFRNKHAPTDFETSKMQPIKELRWPADETEILRHVVGDLRQVPVVVRNALASTNFANKKPGEVLAEVPELLKNKVPLLKATRENQFVWHPPDKKMPSDYTVYSEWHRDFEKDKALNLFKSNPQYQIVGGGNQILSGLLGKTRRGPIGAVVEMQEAAGKASPAAKASAKASIRVSHVGAVTALHYDSGPSQLLQAEGAKEVLLWNSSFLPNLYPYGKDHFMWRRCLADPEQPDHQLLPRFQVSAGFRVVIHRGDLVYWPDRWAHYIRTVEGPSVSIGYRDQIHSVRSQLSTPKDLIAKVERTRYAKGSGTGGFRGRSLAERLDSYMDDDDADLFL